jgi:hypothetical protein
VDDVDLVVRWLQVGLLGAELERSRDDPVELLDPLGELLGVAQLLLDVLLERLADLHRPHAVGVDGVRDVAHDRLDLHPVGLLEELDDLVPLLRVLLGHDVAGCCLRHC